MDSGGRRRGFARIYMCSLPHAHVHARLYAYACARRTEGTMTMMTETMRQPGPRLLPPQHQRVDAVVSGAHVSVWACGLIQPDETKVRHRPQATFRVCVWSYSSSGLDDDDDDDGPGQSTGSAVTTTA